VARALFPGGAVASGGAAASPSPSNSTHDGLPAEAQLTGGEPRSSPCPTLASCAQERTAAWPRTNTSSPKERNGR
jgi:hypothetical protein